MREPSCGACPATRPCLARRLRRANVAAFVFAAGVSLHGGPSGCNQALDRPWGGHRISGPCEPLRPFAVSLNTPTAVDRRGIGCCRPLVLSNASSVVSIRSNASGLAQTGGSPLMAAAGTDQMEVVELLLAHGADANSISKVRLHSNSPGCATISNRIRTHRSLVVANLGLPCSGDGRLNDASGLAESWDSADCCCGHQTR